ncbi:MAG: hypothetical protein HRU00_14400 [Myxococcales bacterium]|nr:hypothetical protein [Myxococcales bacterium]
MPTTRGSFVVIEPWRSDRDGADLFEAISGPGNEELWRHIPFGPPERRERG